VTSTVARVRDGIDPQQLGLILLFLSGRYRIQRDWLLRNGHDIFRATQLLVARTQPDLVTPAGLDAFLEDRGVLERSRSRFLAATPGLRIINGFVCPWPSDAPGRARQVLRASGEPMSKAQIAKVVERTPGTVANALSNSSQFVRVDVDRYGLAEWGATPYQGIVAAMKKVIRSNGGVASVQQITGEVLSRYSVSPMSVRAYLESPHFVRIGPGLYRSRGASEAAPVDPAASLEETSNCFMLDRGWALRLPVNEDRRRGSGTGIPRAFARYLELEPKGDISLATVDSSDGAPLGQIRFTWPAHLPCIGSVSIVLERLGAALGDFLFLEWDPESQKFAALLTRPTSSEDLTSLGAVQGRIGVAIGVPKTELLPTGDVLERLGRALGFQDTAARSMVISRLQRRGDGELIGLARVLFDVEAVRVQSAGGPLLIQSIVKK